jgi:hypothetical protein
VTKFLVPIGSRREQTCDDCKSLLELIISAPPGKVKGSPFVTGGVSRPFDADRDQVKI